MTGKEERQAAALPGRIDRLGDRLARLSKTLPATDRLRGGLRQAALSAAGAAIAYLPTQALSLREGFWGAITAIAVVQNEWGAARGAGRDQFLGASIGGVVGVAVVLTVGQEFVSYLLAVVLAVIVCWLANVASASRLSAITATIILLVPHTGTPAHMLFSRVTEVGWGALVGVTLAWAATRLEKR
ncbi:FUSC family protein [Roseomonas populi]|uniref:FUSC family protein n=1 Tax=Roseomonas populi TaxID=3121582 RepID=A0ABT1WXF4_9PROT|nr:FUSC family protein [Roseomonas pecuniae]MCR0980520.1 FUSC family protein [Roseomonas pecuniae]